MGVGGVGVDLFFQWNSCVAIQGASSMIFTHFRNSKEGVAIKLWDQDMKRYRALSLGPGPCVIRSVCRGKVNRSSTRTSLAFCDTLYCEL